MKTKQELQAEFATLGTKLGYARYQGDVHAQASEDFKREERKLMREMKKINVDLMRFAAKEEQNNAANEQNEQSNTSKEQNESN